MNDITERIKQIIVNDLDTNIKIDKIIDDTKLFEGGIGLDSIALMELISILEKTFAFEFSDEELNLETFQTLSTLTEFVSGKIASA